MSKINLQRGKLLSSYMYVLIIFTPPPIRQRSTAISVSVCLSVCVFVCAPSYLCNYTSDLHQIFSSMLPMAVARSSSGGVVICYVFPVL